MKLNLNLNTVYFLTSVNELSNMIHIKDECVSFVSFVTPLSCRHNSLCIDKENDMMHVPCKTGLYSIDIITKQRNNYFKIIKKRYI